MGIILILESTEIFNIKKYGLIKSNKLNISNKWNKSIKFSKVLSSKEYLEPLSHKNPDFPINNTSNSTKLTKLSMVPLETLNMEPNSTKLLHHHLKIKSNIKLSILQDLSFLLQEKVLYNLLIWLSTKIRSKQKENLSRLISQDFFKFQKNLVIKIIFLQFILFKKIQDQKISILMSI